MFFSKKTLFPIYMILSGVLILSNCKSKDIMNQKETYNYIINFEFDKSLVPRSEDFTIEVKAMGSNGEDSVFSTKSSKPKLTISLNCESEYIILVSAKYHLTYDKKLSPNPSCEMLSDTFSLTFLIQGD